MRLARLWETAPEQASIDPYEAEELARQILAEHGASEEIQKHQSRPVGALLMALKDVKQTRVTYLELAEYEPALGSRDVYNDAIVNIFTRLNTAGRTLTREDITFAWLKIGWKTDYTQKQSAKSCIEDLAQQLGELSLPIAVEDVVSAISFVWAVSFNSGKLLIDEPEISLHPQLQAFLGQELEQIAGDPYEDPTKKLIVISTHSTSMLRMRRLEQISNVVFFSNAITPPRQIPPAAGELQSRNLRALVARLNETHRMAFFAPTVLLVEGPSDEIILSGLTSQLGLPLAGRGVQIVPVTGKGEIVDAAKFFSLMGKRVAVMADLDAWADGNTLVNLFSGLPGAQAIANRRGFASLSDLDGSIRLRLAELVEREWASIAALAGKHPYITKRFDDVKIEVARRRAAAAVLLSSHEDKLAAEWSALRTRMVTLFDALEETGCVILRRGAIEEYFFNTRTPGGTGKPAEAAAQAALFSQHTSDDLCSQYDDILRAVYSAASIVQVDENKFLRGLLAGVLAAGFQHLRQGMSDDELNLLAIGGNPAINRVFRLENSSSERGLAIRVKIVSNLFRRPRFPVEIRYDDNLNVTVANALPAKDEP